MPKRIQRKRTRGWKMPENTVSVCRPGKWGNKYKIGSFLKIINDEVEVSSDDIRFFDPNGTGLYGSIGVIMIADAAHAVHLFEMRQLRYLKDKARAELRGKDLACWCKEGEPCHGDILLKIANE